MLLARRILLASAVGAALLISACGGNRLDPDQAANVGTEVMANVLQTFATANGTIGVEPTAGLAAAGHAAVHPAQLSCTDVGVCAYASATAPETLPCIYGSASTLTVPVAGQASLYGTFDETTNTTTMLETVTDSNFTLNFASPPTAPLGCSYDDEVMLTGGTVGITQTGNIIFDLSNGNIQLPFTLTVDGKVNYEPGAKALTGFPKGTGSCPVDITATYEFATTPTAACTVSAPCAVIAAVSGSVCGRKIPADATVGIGDLPLASAE